MRYQFLNFKLDPQNFKLFFAEEPLDIEPQVFNIILFLLENRERIVSRDELLENLWRNKEVLDATISNHIKIARALLGDDGQKQSVIKTIRGRGYQFIALVKVLSEPKNELQNTKLIETRSGSKLPFSLPKFLYLLLFSLISYSIYYALYTSFNNNKNLADSEIGSVQSIAILPFQNRSNREEDQFFTDGFHDDLLTQISNIENLKTISRTSVMQYRDTTKNLKVIAKELGVTTILEGGVQRSGDKIRINIQLIDAKNDQHIWASTYTRALNAKNVFIIQSEISTKIASALKLALVPSITKLPTQNMKALEFYFRAKENLNGKTSVANKKSIKNLLNAIKADSNFALAQAELASRYLDQIQLDGFPVDQQVNLAQPLIQRSFQLENQHSHIFRVKAKLKMYQENFPLAKHFYEQAIKLNQNNSEALGAFAKYHMFKGDLSKAIVLMRKANKLNPADYELLSDLALMLIKNSDFVEAIEIVDELIRQKPLFAKAYKLKSDISFYFNHNIHQSIKYLEKSIELDPAYIESISSIAKLYRILGIKMQSIFWLERYKTLVVGTRNEEIAQAKIHELKLQFDTAYDIYLKQSQYDHRYLYNLLSIAQKIGKVSSALIHCQNTYPKLFTRDIVIGSRNMASAFTLGRILKEKGQLEQAKLLLSGSLKISERKINGGRQSQHLDWETRVLLARGEKQLALNSFREWIDKGFYSVIPLEHSDYDTLRSEPEFQRLIEIIKNKL